MADRFTILVPLACAADTDKSSFCCPADASSVWRLKGYSIVPNATSTTNGVNYASVRGYKGTGTGTPIAAARDTSATAFTIGVPEVATLATGFPAAGIEITQASPLHFDATHPGTGAALDLMFACDFELARS